MKAEVVQVDIVRHITSCEGTREGISEDVRLKQRSKE